MVKCGTQVYPERYVPPDGARIDYDNREIQTQLHNLESPRDQ